MATTKTIIKVVSVEERVDWVDLDDVRAAGFTDEEILTMVQRYQDTQKYNVAYRERAKVKNVLMKELYEKHMAAAKASQETEESEA